MATSSLIGMKCTTKFSGWLPWPQPSCRCMASGVPGLVGNVWKRVTDSFDTDILTGSN